ncbi:selenide, water dikinase SelD [Chenggangzhangella methanolivorans]|uniref:selenide, water dikinase SelD n=1 Tax=Chenggangzhangella methanolivorans TaxID=1437009 RepID=UPI00360E976E
MTIAVQPPAGEPVRLTSLAHGGGCGCKIAPGVLASLLERQPKHGPFERLLVGTETSDDAAVWALDDETCVIGTTDFFMPMVDDPIDFGRIAATNAISDIYAMGGTPIFALAILGMPVGKIAPEMVAEILKGGAAICAEAGIPVAGGHSIDNPEPVYGLAVVGTCPRDRLRKNSDAKAGDALILTKPLGVGVYSAAIKREGLSAEGYRDFVATTTRLNRIGAEFAKDPAVHAMTDVTGFGVLGHGLEVASGAGVSVVVEAAALPLLPLAEKLSQDGYVTGASHRNWQSYGEAVSLPDGFPDWRRHLLTDPQTSGGLLVSCAPEKAAELVALARGAGFADAAVIGRVEAGAPQVRVEG